MLVDPRTSALILLDLQARVLARVPASDAVLGSATALLEPREPYILNAMVSAVPLRSANETAADLG